VVTTFSGGRGSCTVRFNGIKEVVGMYVVDVSYVQHALCVCVAEWNYMSGFVELYELCFFVTNSEDSRPTWLLVSVSLLGFEQSVCL